MHADGARSALRDRGTSWVQRATMLVVHDTIGSHVRTVLERGLTTTGHDMFRGDCVGQCSPA